MKLKQGFNRYCRLLILFLSIFTDPALEGHGFVEDTAILVCDRERMVYLFDLCSRVHKNEYCWCVASYDAQHNVYTHGKVVKSGCAVTPLTIQFTYYDDQLKIHSSVTCTPLLQEFYSYDTSTWIPAHRLQSGDRLSSVHGFCVVENVENRIGKQTVFLIEIKDTHTFFVGRSGLLTHNMGLPCALNIGLSIPFGIAAGSSAGSFFGPVTMIVGAVIGSAVGIAAQIVCGNRLSEYNIGTPSDEWQDYLHVQNTQTPGNKNSQPGKNTGGPSSNKQPNKQHDNNKKIAEAVKGAKDLADKLAKDAGDKPKARNWNEYFANHEIGQKYKKYFGHTGFSNKDGAPIRRIKKDITNTEMFKESNYVAPDRFHKGDHFEVWNGDGEWIGVANLDGSKNIQKTDMVTNTNSRNLNI